MEIKENLKLEGMTELKYFCSLCNFKCYQKCDWDRHILRKKHIANESNQNSLNENMSFDFACICGKQFKTNSGLWKHQSKGACSTNQIKNNHSTDNDINNTKLIEYLMKENKEIKEMILEIVKNSTHNTIHNTTNTNSHNKAFNLNFFLNETCKDAMNIMDFVDSIKLQLSDLEKMGEVGYTQGISNIITTNLKALDITQRPVHCTDKKRGIMYIKDENKWEKEDDEKTKLRNLIIRVSNKNIKLLPQFREKYPDYKVSTSRTSDKYDKIVLEAMGGGGDNDKEKTEKIIQNISKCVVIDKYE